MTGQDCECICRLGLILHEDCTNEPSFGVIETGLIGILDTVPEVLYCKNCYDKVVGLTQSEGTTVVRFLPERSL